MSSEFWLTDAAATRYTAASKPVDRAPIDKTPSASSAKNPPRAYEKLFSVILALGIVLMVIATTALLAQGHSLPKALSFVHKIEKIGHAGMIGFYIGGGLLSLIGLIGLFRSCFHSKQQELRRD